MTDLLNLSLESTLSIVLWFYCVFSITRKIFLINQGTIATQPQTSLCRIRLYVPIRLWHGRCGADGISLGPLYAGPARDREGADRNSADFSCCSKVLLAEVSHSLIRNRLTHNKVVKLMFGHMNLKLLDGVNSARTTFTFLGRLLQATEKRWCIGESRRGWAPSGCF